MEMIMHDDNEYDDCDDDEADGDNVNTEDFRTITTILFYATKAMNQSELKAKKCQKMRVYSV